MEKIISVNNLNKFYGKKQVLKNISFDLYEGEIVGFVGPNGAGKSTTMKALLTLVSPTSGSINICGHDLKKEREKCLSYISGQIEYPAFYPNLTGKENIDFFALIKNVKKSKVKDVIDFMDINDNINNKVKTYSMGMKQRLAIATALLNDPKLLILDEPTNGLDFKGVIDLRNLLFKLAKEKNISIFISSHYLNEIERLVDRIIWINEGKLLDVNHNKEKKVYSILLSSTINLSNYKNFDIVKYDGADCYYKYKGENLRELVKVITKEEIDIIDIIKEESKLEDEYVDILRNNNA